MAELGSTAIQSLRFRDSWVFVGGKGAAVDSSFEKVNTPFYDWLWKEEVSAGGWKTVNGTRNCNVTPFT